MHHANETSTYDDGDSAHHPPSLGLIEADSEPTRATKRKRADRAKAGQMEALLLKLEEKPFLATRKFPGVLGRENYDHAWKEVAKDLNNVENGAIKTASQWMTVWRDFKSKACSKAAKLSRARRATGNQQIEAAPLTDLEQRAISIVGTHYAVGSSCPDSMPEGGDDSELAQQGVQVQVVEVALVEDPLVDNLGFSPPIELIDTEMAEPAPSSPPVPAASQPLPVTPVSPTASTSRARVPLRRQTQQQQRNRMDNFFDTWTEAFPEYPLTAADLKNPRKVIGAVFQIFNRLGIDKDAIVSAPPEESRDEHTMYYSDLMPVINMTRVVRHFFSVIPNIEILPMYITNFIQPTLYVSQPMLVMLFNCMLFHENRLREIAPFEEELFAKKDQVKILEERKNKLVELLNEQAIEKANCAERLEKLEIDINQSEEELKFEKEAREKEQQELDELLENNRKIDLLLEQKKTVRDNLHAEVARKKALRVYDADDIQSQLEQANKNIQDAEEKLNSLKSTLIQKENCLKNLQTIKPNLDTANNLLHEIMKLSEKDSETVDLDSDSEEGAVEVERTELGEVRAQLAELRAARRDLAAARSAARDTRRDAQQAAYSALQEAEDSAKKYRERAKMATERIQKIKEATVQYEIEKATGIKALKDIEENFCKELKAFEEFIIKKAKEAESRIENKVEENKKS